MCGGRRVEEEGEEGGEREIVKGTSRKPIGSIASSRSILMQH